MKKKATKSPPIPAWIIQNPNDERALGMGYYYDPKPAERVIWFIENFIYHTKGTLAGQPFLLERWEKQIVHRMYGWRRPNGKRRFKKVWFEIGRGNGKSKFVNSLGLYHVIADGVKSAEVYYYAANAKLGEELFQVVVDAIAESKELSDILEPFKREIRFRKNGSVMRVVNAESSNSHGSNPSAIIVDEVHTLKDRKVLEGLLTGLNKRGVGAEPLELYATTAGYPNTVYEELHDYAVCVQNGTIPDLHYLPIIYAVPNDADWTEEKNWYLANPNLGVSIDLETMREECEEAKKSASAQVSFRRLKLNQILQAENQWLRLSDWDACKGHLPADLSGFHVYAGIDLAEVEDMAALALLYYDPKSGKTYVDVHYFVPQAQLLDVGAERHGMYMAWSQDPRANLHVIPGKTIRISVIREHLKRLTEKTQLREASLDPFGAAQLREDLEKDGVKCVVFVQSVSWYTTPCKEFEKATLEGELVHAGNPILRWNVDNAVLESDASKRCMPSKKKSKAKIDGLVAAVMAYDRVIRNKGKVQEAPKRRGVVIIDV